MSILEQAFLYSSTKLIFSTKKLSYFLVPYLINELKINQDPKFKLISQIPTWKWSKYSFIKACAYRAKKKISFNNNILKLEVLNRKKLIIDDYYDTIYLDITPFGKDKEIFLNCKNLFITHSIWGSGEFGKITIHTSRHLNNLKLPGDSKIYMPDLESINNLYLTAQPCQDGEVCVCHIFDKFIYNIFSAVYIGIEKSLENFGNKECNIYFTQDFIYKENLEDFFHEFSEVELFLNKNYLFYGNFDSNECENKYFYKVSIK